MKKTFSFLTLSLLVGLTPVVAAMRPAKAHSTEGLFASRRALNAFPAAATQGASAWKDTDQYNAYVAMANEKDAQKKIALAEAFLAKYPDSAPAVKGLVYSAMLASYQQLNDAAKAIESAKKLVEADPNNLEGLQYLSYVFPFTSKPGDPNASAALSRAESDAKNGLELLAKLRKPANVTDEQFNQAIKPYRDTFNSTIGFVALQRKDYAGAVTSFKAALEDNPSDLYSSEWLGVAYLMSAPPDYNNGLWYLARAVALGNTGKAPDSASFEKYLSEAYCNRHGNKEGLNDVIAQAGTSPNPPADFKVEAVKPPQSTGNPNLDAFNRNLKFPLMQCEDRAASAWNQMKNKPLQLGGFVNSVEKGSDPSVYVVRIALDQSKASSGYDIELKDSTQPDVADLSQGDPVRFQGTIASYTANPSFSLTLDNGRINDDDLAGAAAKAKSKPARRRRPGK